MSGKPQNFPIKGSLLLASPLLDGGMFDRSVVLMTKYGLKTGARGLILNKMTSETLGGISESHSVPQELRSLPIYLGGPVNPEALVFTSLSRENGQFVYTTPITVTEAVTLTRTPGCMVRAFAGHAEWFPGQLEREMDEFTWVHRDTHASILDFEPDERLWKGMLRQLSPYHAVLAEASRKPFLN